MDGGLRVLSGDKLVVSLVSSNRWRKRILNEFLDAISVPHAVTESRSMSTVLLHLSGNSQVREYCHKHPGYYTISRNSFPFA